MAFWTSKKPGALPKWVFWLFAIWAPIDFILTIEEAAATGSQPRAPLPDTIRGIWAVSGPVGMFCLQAKLFEKEVPQPV